MARTTVAVDPRDVVLEGQLTIFDVLDSAVEDLDPSPEVESISW